MSISDIHQCQFVNTEITASTSDITMVVFLLVSMLVPSAMYDQTVTVFLL